MANVTVGHLIDLVKETLQDPDNDDWSMTNLVNWYNLGAREAVRLNPQANMRVEAFALAAGAKQSLPSGGMRVVDVKRNLGADGVTPGKAITKTFKVILDRFDRNWMLAASQDDEILNWMPDEEPTTFWVNPPADGSTKIEVAYSKAPDQIVYDTDGDWEVNLVGVGDEYVHAVFNFIMYAAYRKDTDIPGNEARAANYWSLFLSSLGAPMNTLQPGGI